MRLTVARALILLPHPLYLRLSERLRAWCAHVRVTAYMERGVW